MITQNCYEFKLTSRFLSSSRAFSRLFSNSIINSCSISFFAASTRRATSVSISSFRFSNSNSTLFLTNNSMRLAASSSITWNRKWITFKLSRRQTLHHTTREASMQQTFCSTSFCLRCLSISASRSTSSIFLLRDLEW